MTKEEIIEQLDMGYRQAMQAKIHIFKAQDHVDYVEGLRDVEASLRDLRIRLEAFDIQCRGVRRKLKGNG